MQRIKYSSLSEMKKPDCVVDMEFEDYSASKSQIHSHPKKNQLTMQNQHNDQQELVVFGYIRRIEALIKLNTIIPSTLYYLCIEYFQDNKCFIYFENVNAISFVNLNDTKDNMKKYTNTLDDARDKTEQIISVNTHPNDSKNYGWCGNAYMIYNPTTSFAFIQSNVDLPKNIKNKITDYNENKYIILFQFGGKTWRTDVDCNVFIIDKYLLQSTHQKIDSKIYRWRLSEFDMINHFGFAYSYSFGLICLKINQIYCLSLDCIGNQWEHNKFNALLKSYDKNKPKFCIICKDNKEMLFIVDNSESNNTEIFDLMLNKSYFAESMPFEKDKKVLNIYYDNYKQRIYVIFKKIVDVVCNYTFKYYDIEQNKWYKIAGFSAMEQTDVSELCVWMKNNILYVTSKKWNEIKSLDVRRPKEWLSQKMNVASLFESDKNDNNGIMFHTRYGTNGRNFLCIY
eukprot:93861_1